jgi:hypothetical protein
MRTMGKEMGLPGRFPTAMTGGVRVLIGRLPPGRVTGRTRPPRADFPQGGRCPSELRMLSKRMSHKARCAHKTNGVGSDCSVSHRAADAHRDPTCRPGSVLPDVDNGKGDGPTRPVSHGDDRRGESPDRPVTSIPAEKAKGHHSVKGRSAPVSHRRRMPTRQTEVSQGGTHP